jgi:hypothetical protein
MNVAKLFDALHAVPSDREMNSVALIFCKVW